MSPVPSTKTLNRPRWRAWGGAAALGAAIVILGVGQALAQAGNSIESLTVSKGSSGRTVVKLTLTAPLANPPAGFAINNPPRIALDFPETGNGLGRTAQEVGDAALRSVNVVQAGNRTRVVFNLNKPQTFETQIDGKTVLVTLTEQAGLAADTPTVSRFAEARPGEAAMRFAEGNQALKEAQEIAVLFRAGPIEPADFVVLVVRVVVA